MPTRAFQNVSRLSAAVVVVAVGMWAWGQRDHERTHSPEHDRKPASGVTREAAIETVGGQEIAVRPSDPANAAIETPPALAQELDAMLAEIPEGDEGKRSLQTRLEAERRALVARRGFLERLPENTPTQQREFAQSVLTAHEASIAALQQKLAELERERQ